MNRRLRGPQRGRRSTGQVLVVLALTFTVLVGMAGLAIDAGHNYMARRSAQNASDGSALAAGQQLLTAGGQLQAAPSSGDASIKAAHDFAANNGFSTTYNTTCDSGNSSKFTTTWFDSSGSCTRTSGFTDKVTVNVPPCWTTGNASFPFHFGDSNCTGIDQSQQLPTDCVNTPYNCFQVVVTHRTQNYFLGIFGYGSTYTTTMTVVYASPPGGITPPPYAVFLYQPQTGCNSATQQCFTEGTAPSRTNLTCTGNNCPTFWTQHGTKPVFNSVNGNNVTVNPGDTYPGVQSNGDMVLDDNTTFCDAYTTSSTPVSCQNGHVTTGTQGFSLNGTKLYCKQFAPGGSANGHAACANVALGSDNNTTSSQVFGNEAGFTSSSFTVTMPQPSNSCGGLILNGEAVTASSFHGSAPAAACLPDAGDQYTIEPGLYSYIVINHGQYTFDSGVFEVTGSAPVDTLTSGTADGIDHGNEKTTNPDFDLCNGGQPNSCPTLTAGIWFGHGKLAHAAFNSGSSGSSCGGSGSSGTQAGGGDQTILSGSAVTFKLDSTAGGFVSTNEVSSIQLAGPALGNKQVTGGTPVLIDEENNNFIHLDAQTPSSGMGPSFTGLVYQTSTATRGGVEMDPHMATDNPNAPGLAGQVLAYSFTTFGGSAGGNGATVDFSNGYGGIGLPAIANSGNNEASLVSSVQPLTSDGSGNDVFVMNYTDEWALDAYDSYIQVGSGTGSQVFFSKNMWNPTPGSGTPLPPEPNGTYGSDNNPAFPDVTVGASWTDGGAGSYTKVTDPTTSTYSDYTETVPFGSSTAKYEISGYWTWGHQSDLATTPPWTKPSNYTATVKVTFPAQPGSTVSITMGIYDGDHCGDYAVYQQTFKAPGQPGGGQPVSGSVTIEQ